MLAECDLIILGGGCAGLSLATRLAHLGTHWPRTVVLEGRAHYSNDRSWCFWGDASSGVQFQVGHHWRHVRVQAGARSVIADCGQQPYQFLSASAFYRDAVQTIDAAEHIQLIMGASVTTPLRKSAGTWEVVTGAGLFRARNVIDTRPERQPEQGRAKLWQSFYGREVDCDKAVFDPGCADLMDFSTDSPGEIRFDYVLPLSRTRALIEVTVFGRKPLEAGNLTADLDAAIARRAGGAACTALRSEHGILPMGLAAMRQNGDPSLVRVGIMAGAARPSTGYAFQRIQRWADVCAAAVAKGGAPVGHTTDPLLMRMMDQLFLAVISAKPEMAPDMFVSLFEKAPIQSIIRFLSDRSTLSDKLAIIAALPPRPFLSELKRSLMRQLPALKQRWT